mmetsp:Transcript_11078/g.23781  ORF Transcript_11078/g.23781 Transcript_11078/m.23781 type:complete len:82 (-) Transcript_11078:316-561(-)
MRINQKVHFTSKRKSETYTSGALFIVRAGLLYSTLPSMFLTRCKIESLLGSYGCSLLGISSTAGTGLTNWLTICRIWFAMN